MACRSCLRAMIPKRPGPRPVDTVVHVGRGLCRGCYFRERHRLDDWPLQGRPVSTVVEDVEWFVECGESPEQWAVRLGMTAAGVAKALYRAGRPDLARQVGRIARRERRRVPA